MKRLGLRLSLSYLSLIQTRRKAVQRAKISDFTKPLPGTTRKGLLSFVTLLGLAMEPNGSETNPKPNPYQATYPNWQEELA